MIKLAAALAAILCLSFAHPQPAFGDPPISNEEWARQWMNGSTPTTAPVQHPQEQAADSDVAQEQAAGPLPDHVPTCTLGSAAAAHFERGRIIASLPYGYGSCMTDESTGILLMCKTRQPGVLTVSCVPLKPVMLRWENAR